jgi:serine/threonine protein kinase
MQALNHSNVIRLRFYNTQNFTIGMEIFLDSDGHPYTLESVLFEPEGDTVSKNRYPLAKQIVAGMAYLHKHKRVHNDLKPSNVLVHILLKYHFQLLS